MTKQGAPREINDRRTSSICTVFREVRGSNCTNVAHTKFIKDAQRRTASTPEPIPTPRFLATLEILSPTLSHYHTYTLILYSAIILKYDPAYRTENTTRIF